MRCARVAVALLLALAGFSGSAAAQLAGHAWLGAAPDAGTPDPALESIAAPSRERLAQLAAREAASVDLLQRTEIRIEPDGNVTSRITIVRRFLRSDASDSASNLVFGVRTSDETAQLVRAYTIGRGGVRTPVEPGSIQVTTPQTPLIFSDARDVTIPVPGVAAGTTAIVSFEIRFRAAAWPLPWSAILGTEPMAPAERIEIVADWDAGARPPVWRTNDPKLVCETGNGLRCVKRHTDGVALDPHMEGYLDRAPILAIAAETTWPELAGRIAGLFDAQVGDDAAVAATAKRLVQGRRDAPAKIEALHRYVADEIRYVGLEHGERAVIPERPAVTLERRYGDCKGKVALLVALARAVGIPGRPVLAASGRYDAGAFLLPATGFFDHMIACFPQSDGGEICVDPTTPGLPADESTITRSGGVVLDLVPEAATPRNLRHVDPTWRMAVDQVLRRDCQGGVEIVETRRAGGLAALYYREMLRAATPSDRQRILDEEFREATRTGTTQRWSIANLEPGRREVTISSERSVAPPAGGAEMREVFGLDNWLLHYGLGLRSANAHHPLRATGFRYESRIELKLCPTMRARDFGALLDFRAPYGGLSRAFAATEAGVVISTVFESASGEIPVERVPRYGRFLDATLDQATWWVGIATR